MATALSSDDYVVTPSAYPARTNTDTVTINGLTTTAKTVNFADKIVITVTQNGRLAHWVHVPLDIAATDASAISSSFLDRDEQDANSDLLPMHHLTATTVLGGTVAPLDTLGQTLATQVASAIKQRNERESRMVVFGMGLDKSMMEREAFSELVGLVLGVV